MAMGTLAVTLEANAEFVALAAILAVAVVYVALRRTIRAELRGTKVEVVDAVAGTVAAVAADVSAIGDQVNHASPREQTVRALVLATHERLGDVADALDDTRRRLAVVELSQATSSEHLVELRRHVVTLADRETAQHVQVCARVDELATRIDELALVVTVDEPEATWDGTERRDDNRDQGEPPHAHCD